MADRLPLQTNKPDWRRILNPPVTTTHNGLEKLRWFFKNRIKF